MKRNNMLQGGYQDALRVIGAWLDVRGMYMVGIVENDGELIIEASTAIPGEPSAAERFRLDRDSIERLIGAARHDRGASFGRAIHAQHRDFSLS